jgi:uncharacterized protein YegJ (DUF2314 family)
MCSLVLVPLLLAAAPGQAQQVILKPRSGSPPVLSIPRGHARLSEAGERARATLDVFNRYLPRAARGEVVADLRVTFEEGDIREHMWVTRVTLEKGRYRGTLNSVPSRLRGLAAGDQVWVSPAHVTDWVVVEDGMMVGGFTIMEIRRMLSPKQRQEHDRAAGYGFPPDTSLWNLPPRH